MVKASDRPNTYYVLDPWESRTVLTLEQWADKFTAISTDGKLAVYLTRPQQLGASPSKYTNAPGGLMDPFYNDYFKDLFTYLKENPLSDSAKLKVRCSRVLIH